MSAELRALPDSPRNWLCPEEGLPQSLQDSRPLALQPEIVRPTLEIVAALDGSQCPLFNVWLEPSVFPGGRRKTEPNDRGVVRIFELGGVDLKDLTCRRRRVHSGRAAIGIRVANVTRRIVGEECRTREAAVR